MTEPSIGAGASSATAEAVTADKTFHFLERIANHLSDSRHRYCRATYVFRERDSSPEPYGSRTTCADPPEPVHSPLPPPVPVLYGMAWQGMT